VAVIFDCILVVRVVIELGRAGLEIHVVPVEVGALDRRDKVYCVLTALDGSSLENDFFY